MFYQDIKGGGVSGEGGSNFQQLGESRCEWESIKSMTQLHNVVLAAVRKYREKKKTAGVPIMSLRDE